MTVGEVILCYYVLVSSCTVVSAYTQIAHPTDSAILQTCHWYHNWSALNKLQGDIVVTQITQLWK